MRNDSDENLNLMKDIYRLRIKTTIAMVKKMSFEAFLKKHFEINPGMPACDILQSAVWDCLLAVEYAIKEKDDEIIEHINILIGKLENEESNKEDVSLGKIFAKLLVKAKNVCKAGLPVLGIVAIFEFNDFLRVFKERIVENIFNANKLNAELFYNLTGRHSNN